MKNAKISFLGLDNAGKTSILIALQRKYNFQEEISQLKPTIRIERTSFKFLNTEIFHHDFGGQEQYRKDYLAHKDRFLSNTDLLFFVIDIQDKNRYSEALDYFNQIADYYKTEKIKLPVIIMLHKFDPKLKQDKDIIQGIMNLKKDLNEWLPYLNIYFFETSIYDLYSLIDAFSFGMSQIIQKKELINDFIEQTGKDFNNVALLLFDENGISMSEYFKEHLNQSEKDKIRQIFVNLQRRIKDSNKNTFEFSDWINYQTRVSGVIQSFMVGYLKFYIIFIIDEVSEEEAVKILDKFQSYKEDLSDILQGFIAESNANLI